MDAQKQSPRVRLSIWLVAQRAALIEELGQIAQFFYKWDLQSELVQLKLRKSAHCILRGSEYRARLLEQALESHRFLRASELVEKVLEDLDSDDEDLRSLPMNAEDFILSPPGLCKYCERRCWQ